MKKILLRMFSVIALIAAGAVCAGIYFIHSPEYALMEIIDDVDSSGMDGLTPHLTQDARETVDAISAFTEQKTFSSIVGMLDKTDYAGILKAEIQEIRWEVEDVLKGRKSAEVVLAFNYKDKLIGTIGLSMIREEDEWKIDSLEFPKFEEINF